MPLKLSPNFTLQEMTASDTATSLGIDNMPPDWATLRQLRYLCVKTLEPIRAIFGDRPVIISSGYRCPEVNAAVGGASNSAHLFGCAADFTVPEFGDVDAICHELEDYLEELEIDQLINETGGGARWVHVGRCIPPNTIPRYEYFPLTA